MSMVETVSSASQGLKIYSQVSLSGMVHRHPDQSHSISPFSGGWRKALRMNATGQPHPSPRKEICNCTKRYEICWPGKGPS